MSILPQIPENYVIQSPQNIFNIISFVVLGVLFWQNQPLLSLKLLCPDVNQSSCFYQTPPLPLSLWMLFFTLAGVATSFVWQLLNYLGTKGSSKSKSSASTRYTSEVENTPRSSQTETKFTNTQPFARAKQPIERSSVETTTNVNPPSTHNFTKGSDWEDDRQHDDWDTEESTQENATKQPADKQIKDNKRPQFSKDSATTPSSDTAYSYKFRPANKNKDREVDRVYDANYRVIDPASRKNTNEPMETKPDDDEEWI